VDPTLWKDLPDFDQLEIFDPGVLLILEPTKELEETAFPESVTTSEEEEESVEDTTTSNSSLHKPKTFVYIAYDLIMNEENNQAIAFSDDGLAVQVRDPLTLSETILPKYFRHKNLTSFYRQLNSHGFRTVRSQNNQISHTFIHPNFKRGCEDLLGSIIRKKYGSVHGQKNNHLAVIQPKPHAVLEEKKKKAEATDGDLMKMVQELRENQLKQEKLTVMLQDRNKRLSQENERIISEGDEAFKKMKSMVKDQVDVISKLFGVEASQAFEDQAHSISKEFMSLSSEKFNFTPIDFPHPQEITDAQLMLPDQDLFDLETLISFDDS